MNEHRATSKGVLGVLVLVLLFLALEVRCTLTALHEYNALPGRAERLARDNE